MGPGCRIALFTGPDAFMRTGYTDQLRAALEAAGIKPQIVRFDGSTASVADVLDECRSFGLLAEHKLVVVDDADLLIKEPGESEDGDAAPTDSEVEGVRQPSKLKRRAILERYAAAPSDSATLVLRSSTWRPGNLDKAIAQVGLIKKCDPPEPAKALAWMVSRCRSAYQRALDPAAAEALLESVGVDLALLDAELAKLSLSVRPDEPIGVELVESMVPARSRESKAWVLADYLLNPDPRPALAKLRELIDRADIDPVPLRWACTDTAMKLHTISRELAQGVPPAAAGKTLKLWGSMGERYKSAARRLRPDVAADLLRACIESDYRAKTGQADPALGLELLVMRFAQAMQG